MSQNPYPSTTPPKRRWWLVAIPGVVGALLVAVVHFSIDAANNAHDVDNIIATMQPAQSVYNAKLQKVIDADRIALVKAVKVLNDARYLGATPDYLALYSAQSDAQLAFDLSGSAQLDKLSKAAYEKELEQLDTAFAALAAAQKAVEADMAAAPSPTPAPTP